VAALGALLGIRRTAGTPLEPRPQVAVVDELDGSLLALTDAAGLRRGTLGPAAVCNLCALCEHHRRLEHQAPGWALTATGDGGLTWTTPGGIRITRTRRASAPTMMCSIPDGRRAPTPGGAARSHPTAPPRRADAGAVSAYPCGGSLHQQTTVRMNLVKPSCALT
jgi:hypothetical protein